MTLRARVVGAILFAIALVVGAIYSTVVAIAAGVSWLVLAVSSWFQKYPGWLRPLWYGGLLVAAGATYFLAPTSVVGGAAVTCEQLPAAPVANREMAVAREDLKSARGDLLLSVQRQTVQLLAQASAIRRAHELLPQVRAAARAFAASDSTRAEALAAGADRFQERLVAEHMNSTEAIEARQLELQQLLAQLRKAIEADGAAVDAAARRDELARIINEHSFDAAFTAMATLIEAMNEVVREQGDLKLELEHRVSVEPKFVSYRERVDLHLSRGHFVNLDLGELALQATYVGAGTQIVVGGDGLAPETFAPEQLLTGALSLSTRPRSVWVETRMQVQPGPVQACPGVTLWPFQNVRLAWPQFFDTQIRGLAQLPLSDQPVPFTQSIKKKQAKLTEVLLPRYSLFMQSPVQLKPSEATRWDGNVVDRFEAASDAVTVADLSMIAELLPDTAAIRNRWVYSERELFFPVNWTLALVYLLIASAIGDVFLSKRP